MDQVIQLIGYDFVQNAIAAGMFHSLAIGNDCSVYVWGDNSAGQLGLPRSPQQPRPVRLPGFNVP